MQRLSPIPADPDPAADAELLRAHAAGDPHAFARLYDRYDRPCFLFVRRMLGSAHGQAAEDLLAAVGSTIWFEREEDLDAVTAVSGSGPAYVFYAMEALERAARELGLAEGASRSLALWTFVGATKLAIERGEEPRKLREQVTSKGGTTERALEVLEAADVQQRFVDAVKAACERSRELGDALGKE